MFNSVRGGTLPPQKISIKRKGKEWREGNVDAIIGLRSGNSIQPTSRLEKINVNTNLYWGEYNENDFKLWTNPYKVDDGFPATPQNINIVKPKIDLLIGEFSKRPNNYIAVQAGDEAASLVQRKQRELVLKYLDAEIANTLAPNVVPENDITLDWINEYMTKEFKTVGEKLANRFLDVLNRDLFIENEFLKIWSDYLIKGEGIYYAYVKNGKPVYERVLPEECSYDYSESEELIEKGDWFLRESKLTAYQIYDKYFDRFTEDQLNKLLELGGYNGSFATKSAKDTFSADYNPIRYFDSPFDQAENNSTSTLTLQHAVWRSSKKLGYLTYVDEFGEIQETTVSEEYEPIETDIIEWEWVTEIWEGFKIAGEDFYFSIQPVEYQSSSMLNPNAEFLPYGGIRTRKSLVEIMKPLQYMYILLWYRLELALARDKGKVLNMDITQIPKSMGITPDKWLHYLSSVGVNFINPYESEMVDVPGRDGSRPSAFNQISEMDLSMSRVIAEYIGLMDKIEDMVGDISGVSKQRQGSISSNELVGNVERAVIQSANITEPLFWRMNLLKRNSYTQLLECAKYVYSITGNKYIHYITNDGDRVYLEVTDDFLFSDFQIYVSDSTKDYIKIQKLESLLQSAMQAGASLHEAAEIITDDSVSNIKAKLKSIDMRRQQMEQQQSQMQQQQAQMQQQTAQQQLEQQAATEQAKMDLEEGKSIRQSETAIQVALINQSNKGTEQGVDNASDTIEYEKLNIDRQRVMADINIAVGDQLLANRQLGLEQQKIDNDYELGIKEIAVKRIAAHNKPKTTTKK